MLNFTHTIYIRENRPVTTTTIYRVPTWAATYLYYGDDSGITEEDRALCDDFVRNLDGLRLIEPIEGTRSEFEPYPAFGLATETEDWIAEVL